MKRQARKRDSQRNRTKLAFFKSVQFTTLAIMDDAGLCDFLDNFDLEGGESEDENDDWDIADPEPVNNGDTYKEPELDHDTELAGGGFLDKKADYEKAEEERKFLKDFLVKCQD